MKQRVISIALTLLGVGSGLAFTVISTNADPLKPYVPLAWIFVGIVVVLIIFFNVADAIKFPSLLLLFLPGKQLGPCQIAYNNAEDELIRHPDLEDVDEEERSKLLNSWERIGKDLVVMSKMHPRAKTLIVELTILIASPMLQSGQNERLKNFIDLGSIAYKRAKKLKRWDDATIIAYSIVQAYYNLNTHLRMNDGRIWVDRMRSMYAYSTPSSTLHSELGFLLEEVQGLLLKDDTTRRADAKTKFNNILSGVQTSPSRNKPNIMRMTKNVYFYLGNLAELEMDNRGALTWYEEALNATSQDSPDRLSIYNKLGEAALREKDFAKANTYYSDQLQLVKRLQKKKRGQLWQSHAHKGLITAILQQAPVNIKDAYLQAKHWLKLAKEQHDKEGECKIQTIVIEIADQMYEKYIGPLPSAN